MSVRLIIRQDDAAMAANVGGSVLTTFHTLDVDLPELENFLKAGGRGENGYSHTQLVGAHVIEDPSHD